MLLLLVLAFFTWVAKGRSHCKPANSEEIRPHSVTITEFGAIGDGVTLNTKAFQNAIFYLNSFADKGGAKLFVPPGRWLTGSFDLISHLTLWLDKDAVILGSLVILRLLAKTALLFRILSYKRIIILPWSYSFQNLVSRHCLRFIV